MLERILELLKEKNLTPSQFADEIGIQRSGMSHLISGRNKPSLEFVMKVLHRFPDVKPGWLLYGTVEPVTDTEDDMVMTPRIPATLFDEPDVPEGKQAIKQTRIIKKEKTDRRIERIVIFYDDRSFREYEPER
jgi:transcriptional regulator with XRE-family HTH domain